MLRLLRTTLIAAAALTTPCHASADSQPILSQLEAYQVSVSSEGEEQFGDAERVDPGAVIEYRLNYENTTDAPLDRFVINGRIPQASYYLSNSETVGQQAVFEVRTDDIDWSAPPLMRMVPDDTGIPRPQPVPTNEYAGLRWRLNEPVPAGESVEARYRVRIER